ncbi:lipocalin [Candidatus Phycosocius spiralis]|uniref:Outer membrane lipoprotein Blc n=2 Tax=Candidatus Phycosocius spiralis TaxID=2815099 RepID=A0ABQ4PU38_9PROT|nr:lipocalin [Candidatus Phycosocius spiralis]
MIACITISGCIVGTQGRPKNSPPPVTVPSVDLQRYGGTWYEIARYPNSFQKKCEGVTAHYEVRADGRVGVTNTCAHGTSSGKPRAVKGIASVIAGSNNAKLAVNFTPIPLPKGQGNYWVLYLDSAYQTALVGGPNGDYLWLLARTPKITPAQRTALNDAALQNGYRIDLLKDTIQP